MCNETLIKHRKTGDVLFSMASEYDDPRLNRGLALERAVADGVDLAGADLRRLVASKIDFHGADMAGADFSRSVLINPDFAYCNLQDGHLNHCHIFGGKFAHTDFLRASVMSTSFNASCLDEVDFSNTFLLCSTFENCSFFLAFIGSPEVLDLGQDVAGRRMVAWIKDGEIMINVNAETHSAHDIVSSDATEFEDNGVRARATFALSFAEKAKRQHCFFNRKPQETPVALAA